jgi:hypothetical protein
VQLLLRTQEDMGIAFNGLPINTGNTATVAASQAPLSSVVLQQSLAVASAATTSFSPMTITVLDSVAVAVRLAKYDQALGTPLLLATDAKNIANSLTPTMQSIASERPDLANAHFDFQSNNGAIQVVSSSLSASDKAWIQGKLNGNSSLVQAVQSFHDDAVAGYATWANADGAPLTQVQEAAVSKKADESFSFLNLFQGVGNLAEQFKTVLSGFQTPDGKAMNFAQDPTSATGFLGFMKTAQTMVGVIGNIFELGPNVVMPQFFPGTDYFTPAQIKSLGLNEYA